MVINWNCARLRAAAFGLFGLLTCITGGHAWSQEIQWRLNSVFTEARLEAKFMQAFADRVNEAAKGRLKITVYHGGSLGLRDADVLRLLPAGSAELWIIIPNQLSRDAPEIANSYVTGSILNPEENAKVVPALQDIFRKFFESRDIHVVGFQQSTVFPLAIFCRGAPVTSLAELKGKKVRVFAKEVVDSFAELGVPAQIIPQNDLYVAISTGVIDCALYSYASAKTISLQEVTKSASEFIPYPSMPNVLLGNKRAWETLPADLKEIVNASAAKLWADSSALAMDFSLEEAAKQEFVAKGFTALPPYSQDDRRAFQRAAMKAWVTLAKQGGPALEANRKQVMTALGIAE